jgi:hypothetical protein
MTKTAREQSMTDERLTPSLGQIRRMVPTQPHPATEEDRLRDGSVKGALADGRQSREPAAPSLTTSGDRSQVAVVGSLVEDRIEPLTNWERTRQRRRGVLVMQLARLMARADNASPAGRDAAARAGRLTACLLSRE